MALAQHYRLRQRRTPIEFGLSKVPMPITWEPTFAPPRAPLMKGHGMPQWRLGYGSDPQRIPDWWARRQHEMPQPLELTPEQKAAVDGLISQIKVALARNLNRMIDTFREFDEDYSGKIDTREFRLALHKLGIVAHKSAFDNTFDTLDHDRSGTIDYKELNNHFRRRTTDPSHTKQYNNPDTSVSSRADISAPDSDPFEHQTPTPTAAALAHHENLFSAVSATRRARPASAPFDNTFQVRGTQRSLPEPMVRMPSGRCFTRQAYIDLLIAAQQRYH